MEVRSIKGHPSCAKVNDKVGIRGGNMGVREGYRGGEVEGRESRPGTGDIWDNNGRDQTVGIALHTHTHSSHLPSLPSLYPTSTHSSLCLHQYTHDIYTQHVYSSNLSNVISLLSTVLLHTHLPHQLHVSPSHLTPARPIYTQRPSTPSFYRLISVCTPSY